MASRELVSEPLKSCTELDVASVISPLCELHQRVLKSPLPPLRESASECLNSYIDPNIANILSRTLEAFCSSKDTRFTRFRANTVYLFMSDEQSWPLLEWMETDGTKAMAIFDVDDPDDPMTCSWLIHSGINAEAHAPWTRTNVSWNVTGMSALKTLFGVAQHVLGILEWPTEYAIKLYCQDHLEDQTPDEYECLNAFLMNRLTKYAQLLVDHLFRMEQLNLSFDKVAPYFEEMSKNEGTFLR